MKILIGVDGSAQSLAALDTLCRHLDWFRERVAQSQAIEPKDPAPILAWREQQRNSIRFKADLIGLDEVRGWSRDGKGNVRHKSGPISNGAHTL